MEKNKPCFLQSRVNKIIFQKNYLNTSARNIKNKKKYKYLKKYLKFNNNFINDNEVVAIITPDTDIMKVIANYEPAY